MQNPVMLASFPARLIMIKPQGSILARMLQISTMTVIATFVRLPLHVCWDVCSQMKVPTIAALFEKIHPRIVLVTPTAWNKLRTQSTSVFLENAARGLATGQHKKTSNIQVLRTLFNPNMKMRYSLQGSYDLFHVHPELCTGMIAGFAAQQKAVINTFVPIESVRHVIHDEVEQHRGDSEARTSTHSGDGEARKSTHRGIYFAVDPADTVDQGMVHACLKRAVSQTDLDDDDGDGLIVASTSPDVVPFIRDCLPNSHILPCCHGGDLGKALQTLAHVYAMRILCGAAVVRCVHSNPNTTVEDTYLQTFFHATLAESDLHDESWKSTLSRSASASYAPDSERWNKWQPKKEAAVDEDNVAKAAKEATEAKEAKQTTEAHEAKEAKQTTEAKEANKHDDAKETPAATNPAKNTESGTKLLRINAGVHGGKTGEFVKETEKFVTLRVSSDSGPPVDVRVLKRNATPV
jgi:hypothetical protein